MGGESDAFFSLTIQQYSPLLPSLSPSLPLFLQDKNRVKVIIMGLQVLPAASEVYGMVVLFIRVHQVGRERGREGGKDDQAPFHPAFSLLHRPSLSPSLPSNSTPPSRSSSWGTSPWPSSSSSSPPHLSRGTPPIPSFECGW